MVDARRRACEQGVALIILAASLALHFSMFGHAPPCQRRRFVHPFGQGDDFAVIGGVAFEAEEAGLLARQRVHRLRIGTIGGGIDVGAFAVAEDDEVHGATLARVRLRRKVDFCAALRHCAGP